MPILHAPILEQAGFIESAKAVVNYVAQLDGATQYWQLSEPVIIPAGNDFEMGIKVKVLDSSAVYILSNSASVGDGNRLALSDSGAAFGFGFVNQAFNLAVNDEDFINVSRIGGMTSIENSKGSIQNTEAYDVSIDVIGEKGAFTSSSTTLNGYVYDFYVKIDGVLTNEIPLTNKSQGATQLATVGNVNATMINYTESVWKDKTTL